MSFKKKIGNAKKNKEGKIIYLATEEFMEALNHLHKIAKLQLKSKADKDSLDFTIDEEEMMFFLADSDNLAFDDVIESKEKAHCNKMIKSVEKLREFENHVINENVKEAKKIIEAHGKDLLALNKLLSKGDVTIQPEKGGKAMTIPQSPKINTNISVDATTTMSNCLIYKIENKKSALVASFEGLRDGKNLKAEIVIPGDKGLEAQIFRFMEDQQRLDIEACYKEKINDKTCKKINGSLLSFKKALTQTRLQITL